MSIKETATPCFISQAGTNLKNLQNRLRIVIFPSSNHYFNLTNIFTEGICMIYACSHLMHFTNFFTFHIIIAT
jgi:hypothetical protein